MTARVLMVQGTASSVGKSLLVTALCRILRQDGLRVAPFKAQNMSNNSYVALDGGELGRAQVNQAEAAGLEPETDMNPVLLKPESDHRSQVVLNGQPYRSVEAGEYQKLKVELWPHVTAALDRLLARFDAVIIEGAGSPAEINLYDTDIVNMRVAAYADAPVLLVGDIDRGGVFAHLVGTIELVPLRDRARIQAFAINKFRGDAALLEPGLRILQGRTGLPVAGVIPYMHDVGIADEDSVALDDRRDGVKRLIDVAVMHLPHISNFDDFDALDRDPAVGLRYVDATAKLGRPDLIVLPGTKATVDDLAWLRTRGLADALTAAVRGGAALLGVCGGYQMLGQRIVDPYGVESQERSVRGLGLLDASTEFEPAKATTRVEARVLNGRGMLAGADGSAISGYEIHMGRTYTTESAPFSVQRRRDQGAAAHDGAITGDGWILGTYLHGLLANDAIRSVILRNLAARKGVALHARRVAQDREGAYDRLAAHVRESLDMRLIGDLLRRSGSSAIAAPARNGWAP